MRWMWIFVGFCITMGQGMAGNKKLREEFKPMEDMEGLPRVLLMGDSISIGYTLPVRILLEGKANVHRPPANCGPTIKALEELDTWLGKGSWDVIHFNWGLHDLKYMGPNGQNLADPEDPSSQQQVPPETYEANLTKLVSRLKETGAVLIWCSTTPVPQGAKGRVPGDARIYNAIARKIMEENDVLINDLHTFAKERLDEIQKPANVHFTPEGSRLLAEEVARSIEKGLQLKTESR